MLVVESLSKHYNHNIAVQDVSFEVKEGETLVLLGTSGCGKTTTLRMINRLTEASSGEVYINGKSVFSEPAELLRRSIGYVLQNNGLFPHYTVAENIALVPQLLGWSQELIKERTRLLLEKLHLSPANYWDALPSSLSGGQQQRVGLARALAANPPILLMDEPFGALDPITRASVRKEFRELDELNKKTVVLVTHDIQEAFELGDRICLMDKGRVMQNGTPADLVFRPANDFVQSFIGRERFSLELKAVRLSDVWDMLATDTAVGSVELDSVKGTQSLWEAMERLSESGGAQAVAVYNEVTGERRKIMFPDIPRLLQQYKQAQ
ncbi:ABC transporter ATP-binding protein [Pontibacter korlensis]|uniref:Glycine/betaine ABC transporter ATP-binding protein n=1 Tax=Pontibacter korlensis TaxID=400092 RepID=A0A0E3UW21_9BACT|nr:glycine/betaine ABC transporter ATP-binding protein [Pontibacter korlensis]